MTPNQYLWAQARDRLVAAVAEAGFSTELAELITNYNGECACSDTQHIAPHIR